MLNTLLTQLEKCHVSRFNVEFLPHGLVIFYSNGLCVEDVIAARYFVARWLMENSGAI